MPKRFVDHIASRKTIQLAWQLSEVPFEVLERLRQEGAGVPRATRQPLTVQKRLSKNHPTEVSSKRPVSLFRDISVDGMQRLASHSFGDGIECLYMMMQETSGSEICYAASEIGCASVPFAFCVSLR